ncbi:MAG: hypothetical protein Q8942_15425 [Bacillota bacterium]|nr:hypothetical protein [Bacillota bacterium]
MSLPQLNAEKSIYSYTNYNRLQNIASSDGIRMEGFFDDLWGTVKNIGSAVIDKGPCMIGCLGSSALSCIKCGTDISCWATCAGPQALDCAKKCL